MVLINDDQSDIADIVLDVWLFDQKSNHPSPYYIQPLWSGGFLLLELILDSRNVILDSRKSYIEKFSTFSFSNFSISRILVLARFSTFSILEASLVGPSAKKSPRGKP